MSGVLSISEANELVTQNMRLAYKFARQHKWTKIDDDELESLALQGLVEASRKFDPSKAQFSTFAWLVMETAVRHHRQAAKALCRGGGKSPSQFAQNEDGKDIEIEGGPDDGADRVESKEAIERAMNRLPSRERKILQWRFTDGLTHREIGLKLGLSSGRIGQIEVQALARCRARIGRDKRGLKGSEILVPCCHCRAEFYRRSAEVEYQRRAGRDTFFCSRLCYRKSYCSATGVKLWSEREISRLRREHPEKTQTELAEMLGRSKVAVAQKLVELGLGKLRGWTLDELQFVREWAGKKTHAEIATHLGRTLNAIGVAVRRVGKARRKYRFSDEGHARALQLHSEGNTDTKIAAEFKVDRHTITRWRRKNGLKPHRRDADSIAIAKVTRTRTMLERHGGKNAATIQADRRAADAGIGNWPAARTAREVQVLKALASGPKCRREIAVALGTIRPTAKGYYVIKALNDLVNRGAVVKTGSAGKGSRVETYALDTGLGRLEAVA